MSHIKNLKIVLTGGPGAGKTTAADLLRREIGDAVRIVPEAATLIFKSGFPRLREVEAIRATQETIFSIQKNLEYVMSIKHPDRTLICDRGTLDSAVYWPDGVEAFLKKMNTSLQEQLSYYDAVIFFESAAVGNNQIIEGGNPTRTETIQEAAEIDQRLKEVWSKHPRFYHIPQNQSFIKKMNIATDCILKLLNHKIVV